MDAPQPSRYKPAMIKIAVSILSSVLGLFVVLFCLELSGIHLDHLFAKPVAVVRGWAAEKYPHWQKKVAQRLFTLREDRLPLAVRDLPMIVLHEAPQELISKEDRLALQRLIPEK